MKESSVHQRLTAFLHALDISQTSLAHKIGLPQNSVNNYMRGIRNPSYEFIEALLSSYPDLSAEWLMRGNGDMFLSPDECQDESIIQVLQHKLEELQENYKKKEQQVDDLIDILSSRAKK